MKKSLFSEEKMVRLLRKANIGSVAEVVKKHGISGQTFCFWRKRSWPKARRVIEEKACERLALIAWGIQQPASLIEIGLGTLQENMDTVALWLTRPPEDHDGSARNPNASGGEIISSPLRREPVSESP